MWLVLPTSDYYDGSDALPPLQSQLIQTWFQVGWPGPPTFTILYFYLSLGCLSTPVHYAR
jgi:hypothetical protein